MAQRFAHAALRAGDSHPRGRAAFTLVELILVIALIALLAALLVPSLGGSRRSARMTGTLSNLRHHGTIFAAYTAEHRDQFPALTDPLATYSVIRTPSGSIAVSSLYFGVDVFWWIGLAEQYYAGAWNGPLFRSPLATSNIGPNAYLMSCTLIAAPEYYNPETRQALPAQLRPVRATEVVWPSQKGILVDGMVQRPDYIHSTRGDLDAIMCTADGRAGLFSTARDILPQYGLGDGPDQQAYGAHWPSFLPTTHTIDGVRGRDIR